MNTKSLEDLRSAEVRKSNFLIQKAQQKLGLKAQKTILFLISQIDVGQSEFRTMYFSVSEFCAMCGIDGDSGKNYSDLKETLLELSKPFAFISVGGQKLKAVSWIEKPTIDMGSGRVEIMFDIGMKPYLLSLREKYTVFELRFILRMRSRYSIRMYEIVKSLQYDHKAGAVYQYEYDLDELRKILDAENHKTYQHFNTCVLLPAQKEINEYTDKNFEYEPIRRGRAVVKIKFTISNKNSVELIRIRHEIDKALGPEQYSIWDQMMAR